MSIVKPFTPIRVREDGNISAEVVLRKITFGEGALPSSIIADGEELLAAPIRIVGVEDDSPMVWSTTESMIFSRSDEELVVCGTLQSDQFIVNTCMKLGYDGCMNVDLKLMPRGRTVAQVFGLAAAAQPNYQVGSLIVEIPLKKSAQMYHAYPNTAILGDNGTLVERTSTSSGGFIPEESPRYFPHRPLLWLGNDNRGLCFISESDENWQPADPLRAIEVIDDGDVRLLRLHLLDSHPKKWSNIPTWANPREYNSPISFKLGLEATPVRPFPKTPYLHNGLHIDCFKKIEGNYKEFLYGDFPCDRDGDRVENGYDRMKRLGVTTLILHEKWNQMQNFPSLTEPTAKQLEIIIDECHSRGIKVLPYFGYELSSLSPDWSERSEEITVKDTQGRCSFSAWWRVPPQRDYKVCYNSSWQDTFINGLRTLIEKYRFDGVYLDGTITAWPCANGNHGCGYTDLDGNRHATYPLMAIRNTMRRLYEVLEPLGGIINCHYTDCANVPAMAFMHLGWVGEIMQFGLVKGGARSLPLDYFRSEFSGRNFGVPQELIAYENRPIWTFEQATAFAIIHGILPRPNDINGPLEFMSPIWKIFDSFPFDKSDWIPYWENGEITTGDERVKCSFYRYTDIFGKKQCLIFAANTSDEECEIKLSVGAKYLYGTAEGDKLPKFGFGIYAAEL